MLARVPEIWPAPSQYRRPCQGTPYVHKATERNPAMYYDQFGYCDPTMTAATMTVVQPGFPWGTVLLVAAVGVGGYFVWKYRKRIF